MAFSLTIQLLDAFDVIIGEPEVFSKSVNRGHQCTGVLRVLQTKSMTKFMGCYQEKAVAWKQVSLNKYLLSFHSKKKKKKKKIDSVSSNPLALGKNIPKYHWQILLP